MSLKKIDTFLEKAGIDTDDVKDEIKKIVQEEIDVAKKEVKEKVESNFSEEGKKKIIKKVNDLIDIPFLSEKIEEKIFTAIFNVFEKVLKKIF